MQKETCSCGASMEAQIADGRWPYQEREETVLSEWRNRHRCPNSMYGVRPKDFVCVGCGAKSLSNPDIFVNSAGTTIHKNCPGDGR